MGKIKKGMGTMRSHFCEGGGREGLTEVTLKQRPENSEGMSHKASEGESKGRVVMF